MKYTNRINGTSLAHHFLEEFHSRSAFNMEKLTKEQILATSVIGQCVVLRSKNDFV